LKEIRYHQGGQLPTLAVTVGSHHWQSPLAVTIDSHHRQSQSIATIGSIIGSNHLVQKLFQQQ